VEFNTTDPGNSEKSVSSVNSKAAYLKHLLGRIVKYIQVVVLFAAVACGGILMGEKGVTQKQKLEEKMCLLEKENERLTDEIKSLERKVTLLCSDAKTIETTAKRKLGMARPDETVYIFPTETASAERPASETSLAKDDNMP